MALPPWTCRPGRVFSRILTWVHALAQVSAGLHTKIRQHESLDPRLQSWIHCTFEPFIVEPANNARHQVHMNCLLKDSLNVFSGQVGKRWTNRLALPSIDLWLMGIRWTNEQKQCAFRFTQDASRIVTQPTLS